MVPGLRQHVQAQRNDASNAGTGPGGDIAGFAGRNLAQGVTGQAPDGQPAANVHGQGDDAAKVEVALELLDHTKLGAPVAKALRDDRVPIQVESDTDFDKQYPGAGGVYDPKSNTMYLPRSILDEPVLLATTLAHEGTHHLDDKHDVPVVLGVFRDMALSVGTGAAALLHGHNPVTAWMDGVDARQHETEVNAYTAQAEVSHELGVREFPWDLGENGDGSVATRAQIATRVHDTALYRRDPNQRLLLGGMGVALGAMLPALVTTSILTKVKPNAYLASHMWPIMAPLAVLGGAALVADRVTYHQQLGRDPGQPGYE